MEKRLYFLFLLTGIFIGGFSCGAQERGKEEFNRFLKDIQAEFDSFNQKREQKHRLFRDSIYREFRLYRDSMNFRFARHLRQKWDILPVLPPLRARTYQSALYPRRAEKEERKPGNMVGFYGRELKISEYPPLRLPGTGEEEIAAAWLELAQGDPVNLICECLIYAEEMHLNTWGYYRLLCQVSDLYYPDDARNEKIVFRSFLLNQSGYKCRIGRTDRQQLVLLMPFNEYIYNCPYIWLDNTYYYVLEETESLKIVATCSQEFEASRKLADLYIRRPLRLGKERTLQREYWVPGSDKKISLPLDQNLIDFYSVYPLCDLKVYASAATSSLLDRALQEKISPLLADKNEWERIDWLLRFVYANLNYQTDEQCWGRERYFFPEECLFYPFADCEDIAVVFKYLVWLLTPNDVKLVLYPEHVATAVYFENPVSGKFIFCNGQKYIICDPSYFGSLPGQLTPKVDDRKYLLLSN